MAASFWARARRYYLAGLLVLAPTAITLWVVWRLFLFFDGILGERLRAQGISVLGLGFLLLNVLLLLLGWLATKLLGRRVFAVWDRVMNRVPLINKIYATLRQIAELLLGPPREGSFRRVAVVEYPVPGSYAIGFVTSTASGEVGARLGQRICSVYIPKAVNPVTGYLLLVPEERVTYLEMTPEEAIKMIVSAGALVPPPPAAEKSDKRVLQPPERVR